jgi:competence protein ComEA
MHSDANRENSLAESIHLYKLPILLGGLSVFIIILCIVLLFKSVATTTPIQFSSDSASNSAVLGSSDIKIDIEGAVVRPGLYNVPDGSRVEDAITAAGGLTTQVDDDLLAKTINRAMKLVDGGKIFIPVLGSSPDLDTVSTVSNLVSVNSGSESELDSLSGVGPVTAKKIIDSRPYQTLEELVSKKAIGAALFEKIKDRLSL